MNSDNSLPELSTRLEDQARFLGFNMVGVMEARPGGRLAAYHAWIRRQYHGEMGWMARPDRIARRENPEVILPGIRSIVSVGLDYYSGPIPESVTLDPGRGRFSNYAWSVDYHQVMTPRLEKLAAWLSGYLGEMVASRVYVDTGAILERDHAETAGLGFTGKNTMLINPKRGSWFFLGELLTTAVLTPDRPKTMPSCGTCSRCLNACPTEAFPRPYVLDARRCISYLTIELKGWIPRDLRPLMGNWVYGCDICQEVCPFNRFAVNGSEDMSQTKGFDLAAPKLVDLLALEEDSFNHRFKNTAIQRIGRDRLVRNCCVAAGNWGSQEAVPALVRLLRDPEPLVRGHAAWALGRIGGEEVLSELRMAQFRDQERSVLLEIEWVLGNKKTGLFS